MTGPDVRELIREGRVTVSVPEAGAILGIGRTRSFELARSGELPGVRKLGRRYVVALSELCAFVGLPFPALEGNDSPPDGRHLQAVEVNANR